jgi:hypothetical protein
MIFKTYKEAHEKLGIPGSPQRGTHGTAETGVTSLKITAHPDSYDRIMDNGKTIYYVGKGNKPTPAHPTKNQDSSQQDVFRTSIKTKKKFPVLYKSAPHTIELLGYYRVEDLKKSRRDGLTFYYAVLKKIL